MQFSQLSVALLALTLPCLAQRPTPVASAVPASPSNPSALAVKPLISSEMGGRDLVFLANALDLGRAMAFLADQASKTTNPNLKGFGEDLTRTLTAHAAVIDTVAEMRNIKPPKESPTEKRLAGKFAKLGGIKLEKAIMDAFMDVDERLMSTYRLGLTSADHTIAKFVEQALPQAEKHLHFVQSMAGIAPKRPAGARPAIAANQAFTAPEIAGPAKTEALPVPAAPPERVEDAKNAAPAMPDLPPLPEPIAEAPHEDVAPKKLEREKPKPAKRPTFRTNVKPLAE